MKDTILVLDYGSQYTQLIARRIRELKVFSVIEPYNISKEKIRKINPKGIILSGGPYSVYEKNAPYLNKEILKLGVPVLGICYGMQILAKFLGGEVRKAKKQEYGKTLMYIDDHKSLFFSLPAKIVVWMSHGDYVVKLPPEAVSLSHTQNLKFASFFLPSQKIYGVQFHPEVVHTQLGIQIISNFLFRICECFASWQLEDFIKRKVKEIKKRVGEKKVICALSGGVDSSTLAVLVYKAVGKNLKCVFVDNGLLRKNEKRKTEKIFKKNFKMDLHTIDAASLFLRRLKGVVNPEEKRKIIGHTFIEVFEKEAKKLGVDFLAQGTLYPDVIESTSFFGGPTAKIKSHHNVGGLPQKMKLKLIEPFRQLFKDEVREIAKILGLPEEIVTRHPFPGPGLAVRIIGEINRGRLKILKEADAILEGIIKKRGIYKDLWQAFCVLLPIRSVGVMGDRRTYENVIAIRAVTSLDGMTADWAKIKEDILEEISTSIVNQVKGVNRVVFDITSKPPATIEWE